MTQKIFKDIYPPTNGLFTQVFYAEYPEQYAAIFGTYQPKVYDTLAVLIWGNRYVMDGVTQDTANDYVSAIIAANVTDWVKAAKAMQAEYNALSPTTDTVTRTEDTTESGESGSTTTDSDKAFNDTALSVDKQAQVTDTTEKTRTSTTTETRANLSTAPQTAVLAEYNLRLENWRKSIIFAVINQITLDIY